MAELINEQDSLNQGREKINASILASERAEQNSTEALNTANEALTQSESTQTQLDTIVINGDSSVEAAQARVDENGHAYATLKDRLDSENTAIVTELSETQKNLTDVRNKVPENFGDLILTEHPQVDNPVLTAADITDVANVRFVADPEIVYHNGIYHMFFEVYVQDGVNNVGHVGHATSLDGRKWTYNKIVLQDGNHFALPTILKLDDGFYMIPDRGGRVQGVTLYKATNFPEEWVIDTVLIPDGVHIDPIPFKWGEKWYMVTYTSGVASFYYADDIKSTNWTLHPMSPIATGVNVRGAGRAILSEDCVFIPMQDGTSGVYGEKIKLHKVTNLSPTHFDVHIIEEPLLSAGNNKFWNSKGMHTVNFSFSNRNSNPIIAVDGLGEDGNWSIGIYTTGARDSRVAFRCRRNTPLPIPNAAWSQVTWDTVEYDTQKNYNNIGHKFVTPKTGLYLVSLQIGIDPGGSSFFGNIRINSNGNEVRNSPTNISGTNRQTMKLVDFIMLKRGDEITVDVYQNSGVSKDVMSMGYTSWFSISKID